MYCPTCAKEKTEDGKFCRACGTDLETVSLALDGKLVPRKRRTKGDDDDEEAHWWDAPNTGWEDQYNNPQTTEDWIRKHSAGLNFLAQGATMLAAALLAGVIIIAVGGFTALPVIIWGSVFGWLLFWGIGWLAVGCGALLQSRSMLRLMPAVRQLSSSI